MGKIVTNSPLKILLYVFLMIFIAVASASYIINLIIGRAYPINSSWTTPFSRKALPTDFEPVYKYNVDFDNLCINLYFMPILEVKDLQIRFTILDKDGEEILRIDKYVGDTKGQLPFALTIELSDLGNVFELVKDLEKMDSCTFDVTRGSVTTIETFRKAFQDKAMSK